MIVCLKCVRPDPRFLARSGSGDNFPGVSSTGPGVAQRGCLRLGQSAGLTQRVSPTGVRTEAPPLVMPSIADAVNTVVAHFVGTAPPAVVGLFSGRVSVVDGSSSLMLLLRGQERRSRGPRAPGPGRRDYEGRVRVLGCHPGGSVRTETSSMTVTPRAPAGRVTASDPDRPPADHVMSHVRVAVTVYSPALSQACPQYGDGALTPSGLRYGTVRRQT